MPDGIPATDAEWERYVRNLLKAQLKARGLTYLDLERRLAALGIRQSANNIGGKMGHGRFSATFLIQCLVAVGATELQLPKAIRG